MSIRNKAVLIVSGIAFAVVLVVFIASAGGKASLASVAYLGGQTGPTGWVGRFSVSNSSVAPIKFNPCGIEVYSNGVWRLQYSRASPKVLQPHETDTVEFSPPAGVQKWRGVVSVGQDKKGFAGFIVRMKWLRGQLRTGRGVRSSVRMAFGGGTFTDGGLVRTEEIGNQAHAGESF